MFRRAFFKKDFHGQNTARGAHFLLGSSTYLILTQMDQVNMILATAPYQN